MTKRSKFAEAVADGGNDRVKKALDGVFGRRMSMGSNSDVTEVIPTGIEVLDRYVLGVGGWPVKRMIELYSDPSAGKTSLGFSALAQTQKLGGMAILIETEDSLQVARATIFGVDLEEVFLSEPDTVDGVLDGIRDGLAAIPAGVGPNLIVWDSIATGALAEDTKGMARKAAMMSERMPRLTRAAADKRTAMLFINQTRMKVGVMFGSPITTPGGQTHKFSASVRLQMSKGSQVKKGEEVIGIEPSIYAVKSKIGIPFRKADLRLLFETGWDDRWATITHAKDRKLIPKEAKVTDHTHQQARAALGWDK